MRGIYARVKVVESFQISMLERGRQVGSGCAQQTSTQVPGELPCGKNEPRSLLHPLANGDLLSCRKFATCRSDTKLKEEALILLHRLPRAAPREGSYESTAGEVKVSLRERFQNFENAVKEGA